MKKLFTFLAGAALLGSLSACSSDEPAKRPDGPEKPTTEKAYLSVIISSADNGIGRATTDGNYEDSKIDLEHKVKHAKFLFFDETGTFVLEGTALSDLDFEANKESDNIEYINQKNVIVLDKLTESDEYPSYMLTVLNAPGFTAGSTLTETLSKLSDYQQKVGNGSEAEDCFVMSTSSYLDNGNPGEGGYDNHKDFDLSNNRARYFTTFIKQTDYKTTAKEASEDKPVDVFVERLAAKVQVEISTSLPTITANGKTLYKISKTLAGGGNTDEGDIAGSGSILNTDLYIDLQGWDLSATLPQSYMCKNIRPTSEWALNMWGTNNLWNSIERHRSFWAVSTLYNQNPADFEGEDADANKKLHYVTNDFTTEGHTSTNPTLSKSFGVSDVAYCNEYTNTPTFIISEGSVDKRYVTQAVIRGVVCKADGTPLDMILSNGVLYVKAEYVQYILNRINNAQSKLNIWVKTGTSDTNEDYTQIGSEYFEVKPNSGSTKVGASKVYAKESAIKSLSNLYKYVEGKPAEGDTPEVPASWEPLDNDEKKVAAISELNNQLEEAQPSDASSAIIYDGGLCVYYIPIEHLGAIGPNAKESDLGYYGVVRNHWYKLTIDELASVGHGIWKPEHKTEPLKPEGPESKLYYLGAKINILSWKIVNQSVKL